MFDPADTDRAITRGLNEAMACRDMLTPAPPPPSLWGHLLARVAAVADAFARHDREADPWLRTATPAPMQVRRGIPRWRFPAGRAWR
jgi:hypothetical protein